MPIATHPVYVEFTAKVLLQYSLNTLTPNFFIFFPQTENLIEVYFFKFKSILDDHILKLSIYLFVLL